MIKMIAKNLPVVSHQKVMNAISPPQQVAQGKKIIYVFTSSYFILTVEMDLSSTERVGGSETERWTKNNACLRSSNHRT